MATRKISRSNGTMRPDESGDEIRTHPTTQAASPPLKVPLSLTIPDLIPSEILRHIRQSLSAAKILTAFACEAWESRGIERELAATLRRTLVATGVQIAQIDKLLAPPSRGGKKNEVECKAGRVLEVCHEP